MEFTFAISSALWIGVLTSISPCPLATNIAAMSFITKKINSAKAVFFTGVLYSLGRIITYVLLSFFILQSVYSIPGLSNFLQSQMHKILGPLLIVVGMFLLELITIPLPSPSSSSRLQNIFTSMGTWGAFPLGILFALSFCPVSAALFFGSLIPLATQNASSLILPSMYGIGTGLPVFIFAALIALGTSWVGKAFNNIKKFEYWFRMGTGIIFILVGIYLCLSYIFEII